MRSQQHIKTALAVTIATGAIAAPAASAHGPQSGWIVRPNPDQQATKLARHAAARSPHTTTRIVHPNPDQQTPTPAATTIVRVLNPSSGFDWGDAGIGAAGSLGLAMLTVAGALAISQRRAGRTRQSHGAID